jgi:hypothetical protein
MLFDKNTFIVPVAPADTHVYLKNTDGVVIFVIDPLSVVSLFTVGKEIRIKTKSDLHILPFDTSDNSILALPMLRLALDSIVSQNAPVTGGGTINYVAKFTPNGTTISNSILYDTGTRLGIGTITPAGLLHIKSTSGITFRTESSSGASLDINDNNTISFSGYNVSFIGGTTSSDNLLITGTSGAGYISLPNQAVNVSISGSDTKIFSNSAGNFTFFNNGFAKVFDGLANTSLRTYTLQDKSGTIAHLDDILGIPGTSELPPVISVLNTPPMSPLDGDRYLIGTTPTGIWLTLENQIAEWNTISNSWIYTIPVLNNVVYITNVLMILRFNGTTWVPYQGTAVLQNGNTLSGNMTIGTNDAYKLIFKTNNIPALWINSSQNVGVNIANPTAKLHVVGSFRYVDGNQADTYILTSDINGNATWQAPALLNLQHVLTNGSSTGDIQIVSLNTFSTLNVTNTESSLVWSNGLGVSSGIFSGEVIQNITWTDGTIVSSIHQNASNILLSHSTKIQLSSPINEVSQDATTPLGIVTLQQLQSSIAAAPKKYTETASSFTANVTKTITHNIGNNKISITLWDSATGDMILGFDAHNRTLTSVDIDISVTGNYDIVIIG